MRFEDCQMLIMIGDSAKTIKTIIRGPTQHVS